MNRTEIINHIISKYNFDTYLEIGVSDVNLNFNHIKIKNKIGVDPNPDVWGIDYNMTSDDFFKINKQKFDIIFIDGMHEFHFVYRDIINSLDILNENGVIVLHDCNPENEVIQMVPETKDGIWTNQEWVDFAENWRKLSVDGNWSGDCWKAIVKFRSLHNNFKTFVIDTDFGVGIITKSTKSVEPLILNEELTYKNLEKNRKEWLNLFSIDDFINNI
jgi:hypothetical protein